jgi:hypothetical protein
VGHLKRSAKDMSRFRVIIAEVATGVVRRADAPSIRCFDGQAGLPSRVFEREDEALRFKDDVLVQLSDVEVVVRPEEVSTGGDRFFRKNGIVVSERL